MDKKIYVKNYKNQTLSCLKDLIDFLYSDEESLKRQYLARVTYSDEECSNIECHSARRSFEDLLCIARTYFPRTTETQLMAVLVELNLGFWYCGDVSKIVFHDYNYKITFEHLDSYVNREDEDVYTEGTYTPTDLRRIYEQMN